MLLQIADVAKTALEHCNNGCHDLKIPTKSDILKTKGKLKMMRDHIVNNVLYTMAI